VQGKRNRVFFTFDKLTNEPLDFSDFESIPGYFNPDDAEAPFFGINEWEPNPPTPMRDGETIVQYWLKD
jgi:hypothetical protein